MRVNEITLPELCGGINTRDPEYAIEDNQSPNMMNLWYKDKALVKRDGQVLAVSLADVYRISREFGEAAVVHAGTKLYRWDKRSATNYRGTLDASGGVYPSPTPALAAGDYYIVSVGGTISGTVFAAGDWALYDGEEWHDSLRQIGSGIADSAGVFVEFGDTLYYIDGTEIWQIDSDFSVSAVSPYVPLVMINCAPDLGESDDNESYNLIGAGFAVHYHGDAVSTTYTLPKDSASNLDATTVAVAVDASDLTEGTHFTVDRAAGTVDFTGGTSPHGAPAAGTNNVWITAYQTISGSKAKITGCSAALPFGGESSGTDGGSRVFVMANSDHPLCYWRSDLGASQSFGMRYFPDTSEELLDQNAEPITTAAKMAGEMIVFKTSSIFAVGYAFDGQDVYYPVRECHSRIGCDVPGSVQLIDNQLVFANTSGGVHMLIGTDNRSENTVKPLSANINAMLLGDAGLAGACSCDHERYYWLCCGGRVYLWDYESTPYHNYADYEKAQRRLAWYCFNGIAARDFFEGETLCYAGEDGIVKFIRNKNDFGSAYEAYFVSKAFDLGAPEVEKTFLEAYPSFRGDGNVKVTVTVGNEKTDEYLSREVDIKSFGWDTFNWAAFSWGIVKFSKTVRMILRMKRSSHIQISVTGSEADRGVGLTGLRITYAIGAKNKR